MTQTKKKRTSARSQPKAAPQKVHDAAPEAII